MIQITFQPTSQPLKVCFWCAKPFKVGETTAVDCLACKDKLEAGRSYGRALEKLRKRWWLDAVFGMRCTFCRRICGSWGELDHIRPKFHLYKNYHKLWDQIWNRQLLCRPCNRWKQRRDEETLCRIASGTLIRLGVPRVRWS